MLKPTFLILAVAAISGCNPGADTNAPASAQQAAVPAQCMKDVDCKGDRICEQGACMAPSPASPQPILAKPPTDSPASNSATLAASALENQLLCKNSPEPGKAIRAMLKNGLLKETDFGGDGIPVFAPTNNISVFGHNVTFVAGWEADENGVSAPFSRGPGTAPPLHIAVSFNAKPADLPYKEHRVEGSDGVATGSYSSIDAGSLNLTDSGSTITCYGGYESQQQIQAEQQAAAAAEAAKQAAVNQAAAQVIAAKGFDATFTCGMGGTNHINILACFAGGNGADTELEIQNGDQYGMYKAYNLRGVGVEDRQGFHIHLQPHFAINAQNSQPTLMLGLTIKDANGKVVFQKSAAQYGVIRVRN